MTTHAASRTKSSFYFSANVRRRQRHYVFVSTVRLSVRLSVLLFLRCLWYALTDFNQTFVSNASWDEGELVRFQINHRPSGQGKQSSALLFHRVVII